MGRLRLKKRRQQIRARQKRKAKLAKLRRNYAQAKSRAEKDKILAKANKISPGLSANEFLLSLKKTTKKEKK